VLPHREPPQLIVEVAALLPDLAPLRRVEQARPRRRAAAFTTSTRSTRCPARSEGPCSPCSMGSASSVVAAWDHLSDGVATLAKPEAEQREVVALVQSLKKEIVE